MHRFGARLRTSEPVVRDLADVVRSPLGSTRKGTIWKVKAEKTDLEVAFGCDRLHHSQRWYQKRFNRVRIPERKIISVPTSALGSSRAVGLVSEHE